RTGWIRGRSASRVLCVRRTVRSGGGNRLKERLQHVVVICSFCAFPALSGAGDNDVERGHHDDEAVIETPGPVSVERHAFDGFIGIIPPEEAVVMRGFAVILRETNIEL